MLLCYLQMCPHLYLNEIQPKNRLNCDFPGTMAWTCHRTTLQIISEKLKYSKNVIVRNGNTFCSWSSFQWRTIPKCRNSRLFSKYFSVMNLQGSCWLNWKNGSCAHNEKATQRITCLLMNEDDPVMRDAKTLPNLHSCSTWISARPWSFVQCFVLRMC